MNGKAIKGKGLAVLSVFVLMIAALFAPPARVSAEEAKEEANTLVTRYSDLWTSTEIAVRVGEPVKWYVTVPEDTEPKGCGATIKIPGLGFGTDTHNKEEGHIVLQKGENFIYQFTPSETGDILFTCWMGSGCHSNYIHVTEDGAYSVPKPADPTDISVVRDGDKTVVSFKAPEAPEGSAITGYTVTATAEDGSRKKASGTESPITLSGLDESKEYTIAVVTKGTSGKSAGENKFVLEAVKPAADDKENDTEEKTEHTDDTSSAAESGTSFEKEHVTDTAPAESKDKPSDNSAPAADLKKPEEQTVVTEYGELWTGNITVKAGVHVKWYVNVPEGTAPGGCAKTIKIPGLGWGTDTHNKEEGHLTLEAGRNFVYEFTPSETGDILFTCWMGSGCHHNYIHVTANGDPESNAKKGSGDGHTHNDDDSSAADAVKHTDPDTDSKADSSTVSAADDNADAKKADASAADSSAADSSSAGAGEGSGSGAGSGSASGTNSTSNIVTEAQTVSAAPTADNTADNGAAAAPQSAAANTADGGNPDTGENRIPVLGSLAVLLFLTAAGAAEKKRKHNDK